NLNHPNTPDCYVNQDGIFGPETVAAVKCFQRHNGLTVDGVVGPQTWTKMHGSLVKGGGVCDPNAWCNYIAAIYAFRQWVPSGIWYVQSQANRWDRMDPNSG